jgi:peptidoglycan/xylan/chitin deacetylase (PgdA/CDA1 family)
MKAVMYHYVRPSDPELPYFRHLHIEDFKKQLDYFAEQFGFLSKAEFLRSLQTGVPTAGIILTFDDGFTDHYQYVYPCLRERDLWGVFYIPTGVYHRAKMLDVHRIHMLLGKWGGEMVFDALKTLIREDMLSHRHVEEFRILTYSRQKNDDYTNLVKRTLNYFISYQHRESIIDELVRVFLPDERALTGSFYMSTQEIRQLQADGMIIGSHTVSHPVMSKLTKEEQEKEIVESFNFLEEITGGLTLRTFCYPYGGFYSFTEDTEKILEDNGCLFSFNVESRDIDGFDLKNRVHALPRYDCNQFPFGATREQNCI